MFTYPSEYHDQNDGIESINPRTAELIRQGRNLPPLPPRKFV